MRRQRTIPLHRRSALLACGLLALALAGCRGKASSKESAVTSCAGCHGGADNSAPPGSAHGATATTDLGVGAHQAHVNPGPFRKAVPCSECHVVPAHVGSPGHADGGPAEVVFSGLAVTRGAAPAWDRTTARCSNVYCHGAGLAGGTNPTPIWTQVDGSQVACGTCHGLPPPASSGHPAVAGSGTAACATCHPGTVTADGALDVEGGQHIDGVVQFGAAACAGCHGDATRQPPELAPAPPAVWTTCRTTPCAPAPTPGGGAHLRHLTGAAFAGRIPCAECHSLPQTLLGHPDGELDLAWGELASAGGAVPSWNGTTCANYCHGATLLGGSDTRPAWTATGLGCTSCHGMPPPSPSHTNATPPAASAPSDCARCHPGTVDASGALLVAAGLHLDGYVEVDGLTCASCHGSRSRTVGLQPAPPNDTSGNGATTRLGVGAHLQHLTGTNLRRGIACTECHAAVTTTSHWKGHEATPLAWGPLATTGGSHPTWDRLGATCANTYCHGGTLGGGTNTVPLWTRVDGTQAACGTCHGLPPPEPHVQRNDCGTCHPGFTSGTVNLSLHLNGVNDASGLGCTTCHGDATRAVAANQPAPPSDTRQGSLTTARGVGAHQRHLGGGRLGKAIACTECHAVPTVANHANGTVDLSWGRLAQAGGAAPTWNGTTCANYCHGATLSGGSNTAPTWTRVDGSQTACGTCHGLPPPAPHSRSTDCGGCHTGYTMTSVDVATHMNGVLEATGSCTTCHGDATRAPAVAAAPPVDTQGNTLTSFRGVGAHALHLADGPLRRAVACTECHTVPADLSAHPSGAVELTFGPLARGGGVTPAWNGTSCTSYCHGAALAGGTGTAPVWAASSHDANPACTTCHGMPPATLQRGGAHPGSGSAATDCAGCHSGTVRADGTIDVAGGLHVNGSVEAAGASCTACHGSATRTPAAIAPAPPKVHACAQAACSTPTPGGGAHLAHLAPETAATGAIASAVACSECHVVPTDSAHATGVGAGLVTFGPLARTGGVTPGAWNGSTCSNTYCHGNFPGGAHASPAWTGGALGCTSCHGSPPPAPHVQSTACGSCHPGYGTSTVNAATHVDGRVQSNPMTCTSCHGDPARTLVTGADPQARSAPPVDTRGASAVTARGVGVHLRHVNPTSGAIAAPIPCSACHAVPSSMTHADGTASVTFGARARTGGASPSWNGTTCSGTYCHGNFPGGSSSTPTWTQSGGLTCTTCHPVPNDNCHPPRFVHEEGNGACSGCHRDTNATGTAITASQAGLHVNGVVNGKCTECHNDENRVCN